jgi:hypothetical protein
MKNASPTCIPAAAGTGIARNFLYLMSKSYLYI